MAAYLFDTDVFVDHLRGARRLKIGTHRAHVSVVTRCELVAGTSATKTIEELLEPFHEIEITREVAEQAGRMRREVGIGIADALIAACATTNGLSLVTRNRKHFEKVRGLRIRQPL